VKRLAWQISGPALALAAIGLASCGSARTLSVQANGTVESDDPEVPLLRLLRGLQTRASFLMFTAHPDDEDGGTLVYETRKEGARGALFTITRGEGGQNAVSSDLDDSLGLIRTEELLRSDEYYGVDQYFSSLVDFGFSKTPEETLRKWSHDRLLSDAVRVVRTVRPLVILSEFVGAAVDGHGNHQVAGRLAQEAFLAAGDPNCFPEQIRDGLRPWSPLKIYARLPRAQVTPRGIYDYAADKYVSLELVNLVNQTRSRHLPPATLQIPEGDRAPQSPLTYYQIARAALSLQKSQGGEGTLPRAPFESPYYRLASRVPALPVETSFFDGIDSSLAGNAEIAAGEKKFLSDGLLSVARLVGSAFDQYEAGRPAAAAPFLADSLKIIRVLIEQTCASSLLVSNKDDVLFELRRKERQTEQALTLALKISLQSTSRTGPDGLALGMVSPGETFRVEARILNDGEHDLTVEGIDVVSSDAKNWRRGSDGPAPRLLRAGEKAEWGFSIYVPADASLSRPYFSRASNQQPYYDLLDPRDRNLPLAPYPLSAHARLKYRDVSFDLTRVVESVPADPGSETPTRPVLVGPVISLAVSPSVRAFLIGTPYFPLSCTVRGSGTGPEDGVVRLNLPPGWRSEPGEAHFRLTRHTREQTIAFSIFPGVRQAATYTITAAAYSRGRTFTEGYHLTGYKGLTPYPYYQPAESHAVAVDAALARELKIGFVPGTGNEVPEALTGLGQRVAILDAATLSTADLKTYDAVMIGTGSYSVRPDLKSANDRLLEYVRNGGVLILQYNLQGFDRNYSPYPFTLGSNPQKVVDETAPVQVLEPENALLKWPNTITEADFRGWVEERGHGFPKRWDSHYLPLLETHDPDQFPQRGGLLLARYGKGFYVYDAFALHRQLASGVPGAFRILANLVSLKKNPAVN
jgi:LmbE family N-acetylglucosaminyl deacetylase